MGNAYRMTKPVFAARVRLSKDGNPSLSYEGDTPDFLKTARVNETIAPDTYAKGFRVRTSGCSGRQHVIARDGDWIVYDGAHNFHVFDDFSFRACFTEEL